jgi:hypothetical protein
MAKESPMVNTSTTCRGSAPERRRPGESAIDRLLDGNRSRTHLSLAKDTTISRPIMNDGLVVTIPEVGGLHHRYDRRAA